MVPNAECEAVYRLQVTSSLLYIPQLLFPQSRQQLLHQNQLLESHRNYPQEPTTETAINFTAITADVTCGKHRYAKLMLMPKRDGQGRKVVLSCGWLNDEYWWGIELVDSQNYNAPRCNPHRRAARYHGFPPGTCSSEHQRRSLERVSVDGRC